MSSKVLQSESVFAKWLESLKERDESLYEELVARFRHHTESPEEVRPESSVVTLENVSRESNTDLRATALETIVREGRPAFRVREDRIDFSSTRPEASARIVVDRLTEAAGRIEPLIPLVGRIDVINFPASIDYVGTGWLVADGIVVTNRHVADLIAREDSGKFRFRPGRFGEEMGVSLNFRRESEDETGTSAAARVSRVVWIETDARKADIAFLEIDRRADGTRPKFIPLAPVDARANNDVAVVGYPARAPAHIIPDQAWMDQIYGRTYNIKRVAPGLMGGASRGWATHDCTTLGGNSGSVVLNLKGEAVALHFAGAYMIENYAVPASTIRQYLRDEPWRTSRRRETHPSTLPHKDAATQPGVQAVGGQTSPASPQSPNDLSVGGGAVSFTIPLNITVSLGQPTTTAAGRTGSGTGDGGASAGTATSTTGPRDGNIEDAALALLRQKRAEGVYSVWAGYEINEGQLTDTEVLVVSAHPDKLEAVRAAMPSSYGRFPVEVRRASLDEIMGEAGLAEAPVTSISYNDEDRTGAGFSFDWVEDVMAVKLHVGPERSWTVLADFFCAGRATSWSPPSTSSTRRISRRPWSGSCRKATT